MRFDSPTGGAAESTVNGMIFEHLLTSFGCLFKSFQTSCPVAVLLVWLEDDS